jgi:hypothetical protein
MSEPYLGLGNDGEGGNYLSAWYTRGYTAHLGPDGEMVYTSLIYAPPEDPTLAGFPIDQAMTVVQGRYFDGDRDPLGGFLTFMPSDAFTITDTDSVSLTTGASFYIPRRLLGTETWPSVDSGVSPWAFSMEGSGRIFIYEGLLVARLYATDNPNVVTDSLQPLTYHVTEHFLGGRQYDITVATSTSVLQLNDCIVPGSIQPTAFSPIDPTDGAATDFDAQAVAAGIGTLIVTPVNTPVRIFVFAATNVWIAANPFPYSPAVLCIDTSGNVITGDVSYPNSSTVQVDWGSAIAGVMELS